ncbi:Tectonic-3 [Manis javanica]|nr:Tectonic-3 [Manis javanica]
MLRAPGTVERPSGPLVSSHCGCGNQRRGDLRSVSSPAGSSPRVHSSGRHTRGGQEVPHLRTADGGSLRAPADAETSRRTTPKVTQQVKIRAQPGIPSPRTSQPWGSSAVCDSSPRMPGAMNYPCSAFPEVSSVMNIKGNAGVKEPGLSIGGCQWSLLTTESSVFPSVRLLGLGFHAPVSLASSAGGPGYLSHLTCATPDCKLSAPGDRDQILLRAQWIIKAVERSRGQ